MDPNEAIDKPKTKFQLWVERKGLQQPFSGALFWKGRDFQLCARDRAFQSKRFILSMDKGLGKTSTIQSIFEDPQVNKGRAGFTVLIFCSKRGMLVYERDLKMFPDPEGKIQLVNGKTAGERGNQWRNPSCRYFICTYQTFLGDTGNRIKSKKAGTLSELVVPKWVLDGHSVDGVVCDEFHRVFRNRHSSTFLLFKALFKHIEWFIPMSGSAISKGPEDLWAALHLCDQKFWSTYWGYVKTWCHVDEGGYGRTILGPRLDRVEKWRAAVASYVFHVTAEDVADELPSIMNYPLDVQMTPEERRIHDQLLKEQYAELAPGEYIFSSNRLSNLYKIRLTLICPKVLNPELGYGSGIEAICDDAEEGELARFAIFTPFKAPIPHLEEYVRSRGLQVITLRGGLSTDELGDRLSTWRAFVPGHSGKGIVLLTTIKYAESWEAPEASFGYFLGYEYDNEDNDQARKRLRRLISTAPVRIQWVRHLGSYDEEHLLRLMEKNDNKKAMMDSWNQ